MPRRFQLKGPSIEAIKSRIHAEYGPSAVIISAEHVTVGGLAGFFATKHVEALVEVPGMTAPPVQPARPKPNLTGMAALLEEANSAEAGLHGVDLPPVSTRSGEFGSLLDGLATVMAKETAPEPRTGPGELMIIAGMGTDALTAAESIAASCGKTVTCIGGGLTSGGTGRIDTAAAALSARAEGARQRVGTILAFGLGYRRTLPVYLRALSAVPADQVWLAVDASRKEADTAAWTFSATKAVKVTALAVMNSSETLTPATVNTLGLPVGWTDGPPPRRTVS